MIENPGIQGQADSQVRLRDVEQEANLLVSIQSQVSGNQVDVRIRCSDHENSLDGLGAHKLVLAAARYK